MARLRDETDPEQLHADLRSDSRATIPPRLASLWLKMPDDSVRHLAKVVREMGE